MCLVDSAAGKIRDLDFKTVLTSKQWGILYCLCTDVCVAIGVVCFETCNSFLTVI